MFPSWFIFFTLSELILNEFWLIRNVWTSYSSLLFCASIACVPISTFKLASISTTLVKSHVFFLISRSINHLRIIHRMLLCTDKNNGLDAKCSIIKDLPLTLGLNFTRFWINRWCERKNYSDKDWLQWQRRWSSVLLTRNCSTQDKWLSWAYGRHRNELKFPYYDALRH